jgi:6-phosphogluconolactonase (cycloisomerase 2 family)
MGRQFKTEEEMMVYQKNIQRVFIRVLLAMMLLAPLLAIHSGAAYAAGTAGAVYTQSNETDGNEALVFHRAADGSLVFADSFATGGSGNGAGLGSQGSVILSRNNRFLLAVNAGSDDISLFLVTPDGLELLDVASSEGDMPISLTNYGRLVYVLNAGGAGNIAGFRITAQGKLAFLPGSVRPLSNGGSGAGVGPAQVEFSPDGRQLVVTEKMTNLIDVYKVGRGGVAEGPEVFDSAGQTPFGFAFSKRGTLIVSEAFGGAPDASALSSYEVSGGDLEVISPSVPTLQTAACWVVITNNGKYAYTTNTGSNSVSSYRIGKNGAITLLESVAGETGATPIDMDLSRNSQYLYTLDSGADAISSFRVRADGSLEKIDFDEGLPASSVGLAAR